MRIFLTENALKNRTSSLSFRHQCINMFLPLLFNKNSNVVAAIRNCVVGILSSIRRICPCWYLWDSSGIRMNYSCWITIRCCAWPCAQGGVSIVYTVQSMFADVHLFHACWEVVFMFSAWRSHSIRTVDWRLDFEKTFRLERMIQDDPKIRWYGFFLLRK